MFSFATASTLTMSEDNFWRENHNLPIGWMKTLSTNKLDAQGNCTAPNSKVCQKRDWLLYTLLSSPEGTIFRSRIHMLKSLSTNGRQGGHQMLKTIVLHGKEQFCRFFILSLQFLAPQGALGEDIDGKTYLFGHFQTKPEKAYLA